MNCPSCGSPNAETSRFCTRCGTALTAEAAQLQASGELPPTIVVRTALDQKQQVASYWHTAAVILLLLALSLSGASRAQKMAHGPRPYLYLSTIAVQWVMLGLVYIGIRRRKFTLRELMGHRWRSFEDALLDIGIAAGFWIAVALVLGGLGILMGLSNKAEQMRRALDFLAPSNALELALWVCLAATAGFCEEILYRGYMQRQFAALGKSVPVGVVLSAVVFGASHGYEGPARMLIIGVFGACLGTLAALRKNLRPGMIAHAWQDIFAGFGLFVLRRMGR